MSRHDEAIIPIPWTQRLHDLRQAVLPVVTFVAGSLLVLWLWERQGQLPNAVGEVEAVRVDVAATTDGTLAALPQGAWMLFDRVAAETVIARLDDRPTRAAMATLQAQLARLRSDLVAAGEQVTLDEAGRALDHQQEANQIAWQVQKLRLDVLDRRAVIETSRAEEQRLATELSLLEPLRQRGTVPEYQFVDYRLRRDEVRTRIAEHERALAEAQEQLQTSSAAQQQQHALRRAAQVDKLLGPVEAAITVGARELDELQLRLAGLEIRAPLSGTICAIHCWPGQTVRAGAPLVTVAAEPGRTIVSYVRQEQPIRPTVGMPVAVRIRGARSLPVESVVERVGPHVELVPLHHLRDPKTAEWGQPVSIRPPRELKLRPGELIDVTFLRREET